MAGADRPAAGVRHFETGWQLAKTRCREDGGGGGGGGGRGGALAGACV